ncbi:MAG: right-handed parallel beta-helix repeat-containing protein, partial [Ignavibacteriaceae bacterium]
MVNKILLSAFCLLFTVSIFSQTTYYVSSSSGNDSNSGKSSSSPWKNLSKVNSASFSAGDKILFKRGDAWSDKWDVSYSGSSSNPIYFGDYGSGSLPRFDGNGSQDYIVKLTDNTRYITFENLQFEDCDPKYGDGFIYSTKNSSNIIIENCVFKQGKLSTNSDYAAIKAYDASYFTIQSCEFTGKSGMLYFTANSDATHRDVHHISILDNNFHDIDARPSGAGSVGIPGRGMRFRSNPSPGVGSNLGFEGVVRDITISNNNFTKISSHVIWHEEAKNSANEPLFLDKGEETYNINIIGNNFYLVEGNAIDWGSLSNRNGKFPYSVWSNNTIKYVGFDIEGKETKYFPTNAFNTHGAKQVIIEDNVIDQIGCASGDGNGIIMDYAVNNYYICEDVIIRRNIVSGARYGATGYSSGIRVYRGKNTWIYNNICFNNQAGISLGSNYSYDNKVYNNTLDGNDYGIYLGGRDNFLKNNILSNNKIGFKPYNGNTWDYNLFYGNDEDYTGTNKGPSDVYGNPKFKDLNSKDFSLQSGSAAIDKGLDVSLLSDILGNLIKNKPDIGAYEYNTSGSTSSAPTQPSLSSPSNGSSNISLTINLDWNASTGATSYSIQVSEVSSFTSTILNKTGLTSTNYQISGLKENQKYYWRVNAKNSIGTSSWSSVYNFTTQSINPPPPPPPPPSGNFELVSAENGKLADYASLKSKSGSLGSKVVYCPTTSSSVKFTFNL